MGKYTEDEKAEIVTRYSAGEDPTTIAQSLGKNPFGVNSVIRAHRVKIGELVDPLLGKRGRKPKILDDGAEAPQGQPDITVRVRQPRANGNGHAAQAPLLGMPLFGGEASRVQVHRLRTNPPGPGEGYLADEHGAVTLEDIKTRFGGGQYEFRAFDGARFVRSTRETIGGYSIPSEPAPHDAGNGAFWPVPGYGSSGSDQRIFDLLKEDRSAADERRREDQLREERAAERERIRAEAEATRQREWLTSQQTMAQQQMATMMQMQQNAAAQQTQLLTTMLTTAMGQGNKLTEMITALGAMKDLVGGDGGEDPTVAMIQAAPKIFGELKDLAKMKALEAPAAPGPNGQLSDEQVRKYLYDQLIAQGFTPQEAIDELMKIGKYVDGKVAAKKNGAKRPANVPTSAAPSAARAPVSPPSAGVQQTHAPAGGPAIQQVTVQPNGPAPADEYRGRP